MTPPRPTYRIELRAEPGVVGDQAVRGLRGLLKVLGRSYGLRCVSAVEVTDDDQELPTP